MKESKFVKAKIAAGYVILIAACILSVGYVYREAVRLSAPDGSYALLRVPMEFTKAREPACICERQWLITG